MVFINSGGAAGSGSGASPEAPKDPKEAADAEAGEAAEQLQAKTPHKPASYSPAALVLQHAAQSGMPFCDLSSEE
jgi:type VI secretion system secreted protein VgrG